MLDSPDYDNPTSNDAYFVYYYGEVDDNGMSGGTSYSYGAQTLRIYIIMPASLEVYLV